MNDELSLLQEVSMGSQQAFKLLYDKHRPNIYTTALRITGNTCAAEEILQDTFLKVWLNKESVAHLENFGGWLCTIAKNLTYDFIRKSQNEQRKLLGMTQNSMPVYGQQADHLTEEKEYFGILNQAIKRLPPKQQLTYMLIKQQEMKREEAACELNVSAETVKWNLDQAMRSIRVFCMEHIKER